MSSSTKNLNNKNILEAVNKRWNFAIISHPDAGKTTLTEKLLLYGGAIQQAGACLLYTSPSPRDRTRSRMPSSA